MDTHLLRAFVAVARTLSFTRAAEQLGTTQPLLSRAIRRLEDVVGETLFDRSKRRIALTPPGVALLEEVPALLDHAGLVLRRAQIAGHGAPQTLRVGYTNAMWSHLVYRGIREFREAHPDIQLDFRVMGADDQAAALRSGQIDIGMAGITRMDNRDLQWRTIGREPYVLALPSDWPVARGVPVDVRALQGRPFLIPDPMLAPEAHGASMACFAAAGFEPEVVKWTRDAGEMRFLVAAGIGAGFAFASSLQTRQEGVYFAAIADLPTESHVEIRLSWARQRLPSSLSAFIAKLTDNGYVAEVVADGGKFRLERRGVMESPFLPSTSPRT